MHYEPVDIYSKMNDFYMIEDVQPIKNGPRYITYARVIPDRPEYSMELTRYVKKRVPVKKIMKRDNKDVEVETYENRTVAEKYTAPVQDCEILRITMRTNVAGFGLMNETYSIEPIERTDILNGMNDRKWHHFHKAGFYRKVFATSAEHLLRPDDFTGVVIKKPLNTHP